EKRSVRCAEDQDIELRHERDSENQVVIGCKKSSATIRTLKFSARRAANSHSVLAAFLHGHLPVKSGRTIVRIIVRGHGNVKFLATLRCIRCNANALCPH